VPVKDADGKPIVAAKYTGLHALRHFYASWCINWREDGGLGLPLKMVQHCLGHSTIGRTADTYGLGAPSLFIGRARLQRTLPRLQRHS
jgi:integrase